MHFTVVAPVFCQGPDFHGEGGRMVMETLVCLHPENVCTGSQCVALIQVYTDANTVLDSAQISGVVLLSPSVSSSPDPSHLLTWTSV